MPEQAPYPTTPWWQTAEPRMSLEDTKGAWERSGEISKNYPYEHQTRGDLMKQLNDVGEAIIRKGSNVHKDLKKNPLPDYDMMEMHPGYFEEPMDPAQREWFEKEGGMIYLKRKPLTS